MERNLQNIVQKLCDYEPVDDGSLLCHPEKINREKNPGFKG